MVIVILKACGSLICQIGSIKNASGLVTRWRFNRAAEVSCWKRQGVYQK
jgi:hypothetical protein